MSETKNEIWEWIKSIIIAVIIALFIRAFIVEIFVVEGRSMLPTLEHHERLIVNKMVYRFKEPSYGDIVVFSYSPDRDFIKRIIAKGGDTIKVKNQVVYRNGEPLEEEYVNDKPVLDFGPVTVPRNHVFVMGDNRNNSMDSRESEVGFISMERLKGKAVVVFWPLEKFSLVNN